MIHRCLSAILKQSYPRARMEILVIDDRSTDRTAEIVRKVAKKNTGVRLVQVTDTLPNVAPKKRALNLGVRQAKGEIIVTTDADCLPGRDWVAEMVKYFDSGVGLVAGYNPYRHWGSTLSQFSRILALDYFAMAAVAAASAGLGHPISCSGGNLAYRKKVYQQVGGFGPCSAWVSGDDDLLLQRVRQETRWKVRYAVAPNTFVPTAPPLSFKEFWNQRVRYASKCALYPRPVTNILIAVYLTNFLLAAGLPALPFFPQIITPWLGAICVKFGAEWWLLSRAKKLFRESYNLTVLLLTAILHPIYITLIAPAGQFFNFEWKRDRYPARLDGQPRPLAGRLMK
ncbi:glycosyltransferase [bacterium]|nr:glycosyltransferase [bacterium]